MKAGVFPPESRRSFGRLFDSLEVAFRMEMVELKPEEEDIGSFSAMFLFRENPHLERLSEELRIPSFRVCTGSGIRLPVKASASIRFEQGKHLDPIIRGRVLTETWSPPAEGIREEPGEEVSARCGDIPIWVTRKRYETIHYRVSVEPDRLAENEILWNGIRRGRFIRTFLPVHFLKNAVGIESWNTPPLRAAFIVDDPNIRGSTYGYINFKQLADHAERHNYHAIMATVPIDIRRMNGRVCDLFRCASARLSLTVHGILHSKHELARVPSMEKAEQYLAFGIRLMNRFERRYGIRIARIMIVPYEKISRITTRALVTSGFEGICVNGKPYPYTTSSEGEDLLAGWNIASMITDGLPVFLRDKVLNVIDDKGSGVCQDQVIKAFLGQPLLLYAHHEDFKRGYDIFGEAADYINSLGNIRWESLDSIVRSSYLHKISGDTISIRMFSRHVELTVPFGIRHMYIEKFISNSDKELLVFITGEYASMSDLSRERIFDVSPGEPVSITLLSVDAMDPEDSDPPRRIALSIMRRRLCELRDNARTLIKV